MLLSSVSLPPDNVSLPSTPHGPAGKQKASCTLKFLEKDPGTYMSQARSSKHTGQLTPSFPPFQTSTLSKELLAHTMETPVSVTGRDMSNDAVLAVI